MFCVGNVKYSRICENISVIGDANSSVLKTQQLCVTIVLGSFMNIYLLVGFCSSPAGRRS